MRIYFIVWFYMALALKGYAQNMTEEKAWKLGLNYGQASQNRFPLDNRNYIYNNTYFKAQINYTFLKKHKLSYELHIEPSIYFSTHRLLNEDFITPDNYPDYLRQREVFTQERTFNEYVINLGLIVRYEVFQDFSTYAIGSVGPMISGAETERLKKGFAFSDIIGLGLSYQVRKVLLDLRTTLRHNSNANLFKPNFGHNSFGVEYGMVYSF